MVLEISGDRVGHRPDKLFTVAFVCVNVEIGLEQLVGFFDGEAELEPISSGADHFGFNVVLFQPVTDGGYGLGRRLDVLLDLQSRRLDHTRQKGSGAADSPVPWKDAGRSGDSPGR